MASRSSYLCMVKEEDTALWALLAKYLTNEATLLERIQADNLLKERAEVKSDFLKFSAIYYLNENTRELPPVEALKKLNQKIKENKK